MMDDVKMRYREERTKLVITVLPGDKNWSLVCLRPGVQYWDSDARVWRDMVTDEIKENV